MRFATVMPATPGNLEITVVVLPGSSGSEVANVNRWRGQLNLPPIDESAVASGRQVVKSKAGEVVVFDMTGEGTKKSRTVAGMVTTPDGNTWFLKMTGDDEPVGRTKPAFLHWMETLRLD